MKTLLFLAFILCTASVGKLSSLFKVDFFVQRKLKYKVFGVEYIHMQYLLCIDRFHCHAIKK